MYSHFLLFFIIPLRSSAFLFLFFLLLISFPPSFFGWIHLYTNGHHRRQVFLSQKEKKNNNSNIEKKGIRFTSTTDLDVGISLPVVFVIFSSSSSFNIFSHGGGVFRPNSFFFLLGIKKQNKKIEDDCQNSVVDTGRLFLMAYPTGYTYNI